ncbi:MAG TPA: HAD family phosphatase [Vicinamibacterales bacterium]|nr:HAD family phosphatase [Vicinamibacterales bacterium]
MLKAIIFDFDGVIADSEPLHFASFRDILAEEGIALTEAEYYAQYLGFDDVGALTNIGAMQSQPWTTTRVTRLAERKAERFEALQRDAPVLFEGAADAIVRAAADVPIAIASGALHAEIERVLDRAGLTPYFAAIVGADDTRLSKPAPDPYLRALEGLAAAAGEPIEAAGCVAIEDSQWGLQSARAAGLHTVAVAHTYTHGELPLADLVIPTISVLDLSILRILVSHRSL